MLLKVMKGGLGGVITPWVILGGGSLSPGSISALRVTGDPAKGDPGGGTHPTPLTPLIAFQQHPLTVGKTYGQQLHVRTVEI